MKRNKNFDPVNTQEDEDGYVVHRGPTPDKERGSAMPDINVRDYDKDSEIRASVPATGNLFNSVSGNQKKTAR